MADPLEVAEKIASRAAEICAPLELEMALRKWPKEFRIIMWQAVAAHANGLASEQGDRKCG